MTILHLDAVYSADEAAAILQVHPKTLKLWVREGKMEASLLGGRRRPTLRFTGRAIQKYLDSATKPTAPPVVRPGRPRKVLTFSAELADRACGLR